METHLWFHSVKLLYISLLYYVVQYRGELLRFSIILLKAKIQDWYCYVHWCSTDMLSSDFFHNLENSQRANSKEKKCLVPQVSMNLQRNKGWAIKVLFYLFLNITRWHHKHSEVWFFFIQTWFKDNNTTNPIIIRFLLETFKLSCI